MVLDFYLYKHFPLWNLFFWTSVEVFLGLAYGSGVLKEVFLGN